MRTTVLSGMVITALVGCPSIEFGTVHAAPLTGSYDDTALAAIADVSISASGLTNPVWKAQTVGDLDGDGNVDLAFGDKALGGHKVFIVYQPTNGLPSSFNLSNVQGAGGNDSVDGSVLTNNLSNMGDARVRLSSGDINNDGTSDLLLGIQLNYGFNPLTAATFASGGQSFLIYGQTGANRIEGAVSLGSIGFTDPGDAGYIKGAVFNGYSNDHLAGSAIVSGADVNGDGIDDIILGASGFDDGGAPGDDRGSISFIYGQSASGSSELVDTYTLQGIGETQVTPGILPTWLPNDFPLEDYPEHYVRPLAGTDYVPSDSLHNALGESIAVGDFNGDGKNDVIVAGGGGFASGPLGTVHIISGADIENNDFSSIAHYETNGSNNSLIVSVPGDVNGDGYDDFLIDGDSDGQVLVYGQSGTALLTGDHLLSTVGDPQQQGILYSGIQITDSSSTGERFAMRVAGDFNGDGLDDILLTSQKPISGSTALNKDSYLIYGKPDGDVSELLGSIDVTNVGISPTDPDYIAGIYFDDLGELSGGEDINGDGVDDLIVTNEDDDIIYIIYGIQNGAGDLNGDGYVDSNDQAPCYGKLESDRKKRRVGSWRPVGGMRFVGTSPT